MPFVFTEWQELPEPIVSLSCRKFVRITMFGLVLVGAPPLATDTQIVNKALSDCEHALDVDVAGKNARGSMAKQ